MLLVPSLKPNRLRGVSWSTEVDDVRPYPTWLHRRAAVPKAMRVRLRIAWTQTWASLEHAWISRSPSDWAAWSWSPEKEGMPSLRIAGILAARPKRSLPSASTNRPLPTPKVMVRPLGL